jgi:hypothetical protein
MSKKSKSKKKDVKKSNKKKYPSGVEDRIKSINTIKLPDENPHKKENEDLLDRWRPSFRNDRATMKEKSRYSQRGNRPKKSQKVKLF